MEGDDAEPESEGGEWPLFVRAAAITVLPGWWLVSAALWTEPHNQTSL